MMLVGLQPLRGRRLLPDLGPGCKGSGGIRRTVYHGRRLRWISQVGPETRADLSPEQPTNGSRRVLRTLPPVSNTDRSNKISLNAGRGSGGFLTGGKGLPGRARSAQDEGQEEPGASGAGAPDMVHLAADPHL